MERNNMSSEELMEDAAMVRMSPEEEAEARAEAIVANNLRYYLQGCEVPKDALKSIVAGRLKGMSDVNPMWRMKRMTEIFGPVGFGWRYTVDRQWTETYGDEVKCFCNVSLYVRDPETREWSEAIPGCGGSAIVSKESKGIYVNDEGYKMALTDALSIAMKPLGIGANIWYDPKATGHNESKYEEATRTRTQQNGAQSQPRQAQGVSQVVFTGEQLNQAIRDIGTATTEAQFHSVWNKWAKTVPSLANPGTEFYKVASQKINEIKNSPVK